MRRGLFTPLFRLASWCMVLLYALASGRGLAPEVCATLREMAPVVAGETTPVARAAHACCQMPPASGTQDSGRKRPVSPQQSNCPLCHLVHAVNLVAAPVEIPIVAAPRFGSPLLLASQTPREVSLDAAPMRAPPA